MDTTSNQQRRAKFSATVDAELLETVDRYVEEHDTINRSMIIDEALRLWTARERERAIEQQIRAPQSEQEQLERAAWRELRRATTAQRLVHDRWTRTIGPDAARSGGRSHQANLATRTNHARYSWSR